jgi:hypothetical protein
LVISSSVYDDEGNFYYQKDEGACDKLNMEELYEKIRPFDGADLNIDVAFINIINGEKIANVFK